ncbi:carbohydrate ABC transporter permease [Eisenbergiella porci]|uniref:carbohydrate ABC transporter permease n=1 Tax=Eisenbergiella porci TaxID=2652274 RepID=UPI002A801E1F|nr:carbohydrate ABC transporter permease [Eisenbergiella porci]
MSQKKNRKIKTITVLVILIIGSLIFLYPLLWMVASSFRSLEEIAVKGMNLIPERPSLKYYQKALTSFSFFTYFKNSMIVSVISIIATVFANSMIGYAFARFKVKGSNVLFMLVLATMLLPGEVMQIPKFIMFKNFGMLDTLYPLFITKLFGSAFYIFLFRQFYSRLPSSLEEAARLDGCSYFGIWTKIFIPLSLPICTSVGIMEFMGSWNSFNDPLIYINSDKWKTLPLGLAGFQGTYSTDTNLLMAASLIVILPCVILFFCAQKAFVEGVTFSGGKE